MGVPDSSTGTTAQTVSLSEFLDAMHQFAGKSPNDKIKFLFKVYDLDESEKLQSLKELDCKRCGVFESSDMWCRSCRFRYDVGNVGLFWCGGCGWGSDVVDVVLFRCDGLIQQSELQKVMKACMEENGMKFSDEQIEDLTLALFEDADTQRTGAITYESLKAQLEKHDGLLENLSISIDRWLVPPNIRTEKESIWKRVAKIRPYQLTLPYLKNNYVYLIFLLVYIAINLGLFISRAIEYRESNWYTIFARACGLNSNCQCLNFNCQCLNFNCMFVLVLMLRQCITYLRSLGASAFLPLDQHLYLHKLCGWFIFIYSLVHTLMHLLNFSLVVAPSTDYTLAEWLFTMKPEKFGLIEGIANPTGIALMIILTLMVICSLPFVRKSGYFEVFYWTHLLYVAFWILTILHGPNFWKWFVAPGVIFVIERVHRTIRLRTGHGKTYISSGVLLPSKVIHLVIKRPGGFQFHPGDYVFVNIPAIAKYEWHPFTISSAPEQGDAVWLHIRAVGEWTNRLYGYFEREQLRCERQRCEIQGQTSVSVMMTDGENVEVRMHPSSDLHSHDKTSQLAIMNEAAPTEGASCSTDKTVENGYTNEGFEHDTNGNAVDQEAAAAALPKNYKLLANHKNQSAPSLVHNSVNGKKVLMKSRSVPDFDRKIHTQEHRKHSRHFNVLRLLNNFRPKSDQKFNQSTLSKALQATLDGEVQMPSRRELAKSFRYMRRKPKIITLDLPSESEAEEEEEEMADTAGKETVLALEEGRKSYAVSQEEQRQRRKSRQEERRIYVDGPFGAPSSHIFRAQHAVLIGTGIGVTPFASILQSIMHKYWKARHVCPNCSYSWTNDVPDSVMNLRKVDFFWINRDQRSFEWFVNLLSQLEIEQAEHGGVMERFLDMHMYITSALQKTDMKAVGLQLALDLLHEKEKRDLITGLKTRTNAGRPNWDKVFKQLQNQQKGKITVFYCGPPALARTLRYKCDEYGFDFRKEIF
nr:NADPH oxidase 5-like [Penaeus vannamei]